MHQWTLCITVPCRSVSDPLCGASQPLNGDEMVRLALRQQHPQLYRDSHSSSRDASAEMVSGGDRQPTGGPFLWYIAGLLWQVLRIIARPTPQSLLHVRSILYPQTLLFEEDIRSSAARC